MAPVGLGANLPRMSAGGEGRRGYHPPQEARLSNDSDRPAGGAAADWQDVGAAQALADGTRRGVDVGGERVLLARVHGCVRAIGGLCSHQIAHLEDGVLEAGGAGGIVRCPRHGSGFDLVTGEPLDPPADMPVDVYDVREQGGRLLVRPRPCPGS
jgi:3-phenylpropionate/trans-cinnamate dioxygenase ferredoxin subunit